MANTALVHFMQVNYQLRHFARNSRAQYEQQLIVEYSQAPKLFQSYIHKKKKGRLSVGPLRVPTGELTDSLESMAKLLADTYSSVFVAKVPVSPSPHQVYGETIQNIVITVGGAHDVLLGLD